MAPERNANELAMLIQYAGDVNLAIVHIRLNLLRQRRSDQRNSRQRTEDWFPSRTSVDRDGDTTEMFQEEKESSSVRNYTGIRNRTSRWIK